MAVPCFGFTNASGWNSCASRLRTSADGSKYTSLGSVRLDETAFGLRLAIVKRSLLAITESVRGSLPGVSESIWASTAGIAEPTLTHITGGLFGARTP